MARLETERTRLLGGLLCASLLWPGAAWAQSYEAVLLEGIRARDQALATHESEDWRQALTLLNRALSYRATAEALFERALVFEALDRSVEALNDFAAALDLGLPPRAAEQAARFISQHEPRLGRVLLRGPDGAIVSGLGNRPVQLPMARPLFVPAGEIELRVDAPPALRWQGPLRIAPRELVTQDIQLVTVEAPAAAAQPLKAQGGAANWRLGARIAGTALMVGGGSSVLVTSLLLPGARRDLKGHCLDESGGRCVRALESELPQAQAAADRIETLRALRWVGVGALLAGAIGLGGGLFILPNSSKAQSAEVPKLWLSQTSAASVVGLRGQF